jgi:lipopolysaccharide biosynthesis protein
MPGPVSNQMNDVNSGSEPKLIAFYLPQFYPFAENDEWWGKGFTEWTNVTKAEPLFRGHYQPHLPTDLGFYDLRLRDARREQISLAKQYGIDGFCYHFYWFSGKRLLDVPVDDMLADPQSDMPFCLCWANENWTRRWDAAEHHVLIAQKNEPGDTERVFNSLLTYFNDPRYIKVDGKPLVIVYRPQNHPSPVELADRWRELAVAHGFPGVHLVSALTHGNTDYAQFGFDAGVEFPPHNRKATEMRKMIPMFEPFRGSVEDFADVATHYLKKTDYPGDVVYRTIFPSWDNTARRGSNAFVVLNGTPENYEYWLDQTIKQTVARQPANQQFVFINAWNEWAEGCHLEPDRRYGRRFLEATLRAKTSLSTLTDFPHRGVPKIEANRREVRPEDRINPVQKVRREIIRIGRQIVQQKKTVSVRDIPKG